MPSQRLTVSVPQPCHEAWNAMAPQGQGRFCQSCAKTVTDFTAMSDAEVVRWLSQHQGPTCGRFRKDQIGKELVAVTYNRKRWTWQAVMLGLSAWLSSKTVEAKQSQFMLPNTSQTSASMELSEITGKRLPQSGKQIILKGTVIDELSKEALPGVALLLKGTPIKTQTDQFGNFELIIPARLATKKQIILFAYIGYIHKEVNLSQLLKQTNLKVIMKPDTAMLGGMAIHYHSQKSLFQKVKSFLS